jgi:hypothetical protein
MGLIIAALAMSFAVHGQDALKDQRDIVESLAKHGITVIRQLSQSPTPVMSAHAIVADAATAKALEMLPRVSNLSIVNIGIQDAKLNEACLRAIAKIPALKTLRYTTESVTGAELKILGRREGLAELDLDCRELSDAELKEIRAMSQLKALNLSCFKVPDKSIDDLKKALPKAKINIQIKPALFALRPIPTDPRDDPFTRLRKAKWNAALAALIASQELLSYSGPVPWDPNARTFLVIDHARRLIDATFDLEDPKLAVNVMERYVDLTRRVHDEARIRYQAGNVTAETMHRVEYHYFDAQILQIRLKKKSDGT